MSLVAVNAEELAVVVELACLTESRTNDEHRALLHVAEKCDRERNLQVTRNIAYPGQEPGDRMWSLVPGEYETEGRNAGTIKLERIRRPSLLELLAHSTRDLDPADKERPIKPSWERKAKR